MRIWVSARAPTNNPQDRSANAFLSPPENNPPPFSRHSPTTKKRDALLKNGGAHSSPPVEPTTLRTPRAQRRLSRRERTAETSDLGRGGKLYDSRFFSGISPNDACTCRTRTRTPELGSPRGLRRRGKFRKSPSSADGAAFALSQHMKTKTKRQHFKILKANFCFRYSKFATANKLAVAVEVCTTAKRWR